MKQIKLYFFTFSFFFCSFLISSKAQTFVELHGKLSVKGTSLVDQNGEIIILKGVSLGWHNWWPRFYNKSTVEWLKSDWNCNLIRIPIGVEPRGAYLDNPEKAIDCLDHVVESAIEKGMYVIVDWHAHSIRTKEAKSFFTRVANKYKDYPNIIYEIFNEPRKQLWEEVKSYSEEIIKTIREIDQNNIILVGTPHWCQDVHLAADDPIVGYHNIMYTFHFYAGTIKYDIRKRGDYALGKGIPIFVSECGAMEANGNGEIDYVEWFNWLNWMKKNNVSWVAWCISDKNESCSMIKNKRSPASKWKDDDLKVWGKMVRKRLKEN